MRAIPYVALLCILTCFACVPAQPDAQPSPENVASSRQGPGLPTPEVWLTPVDLTTGTGPEVVARLSVMNSGIPLGDALNPLLRNVSLRAWPSLVRVEAQAHVAGALPMAAVPALVD